MGIIVCTPSIKGIDDVICKEVSYFSGYPMSVVAAARSLYEARTGTSLLEDDVDYSQEEVVSIGNTLARFLQQSQERDRKRTHLTSTNVSSAIQSLYKDYPKTQDLRQASKRIANRISALAEKHMALENAPKPFVDKDGTTKYRAVKNTRTKLDILKGYKQQGQFKYGEIALYNELYDMFVKDYLTLVQKREADPDSITKEDNMREEELYRMLTNWESLCMLSRYHLKTTEGLQLGLHHSYAKEDVDAFESFYELAEISEIYDPEINTKESYQEYKERKSTFASLTAEMKSALSFIPTGKKDILGDDIYHDPKEVVSLISDACFGVTSAESMLSALNIAAKNANKNQGSIFTYLYHKMSTDDQMKTLFFVNFFKGFSEYKEAVVSRNMFNMKSLNTRYASSRDSWALKLKQNTLDIAESQIFGKADTGQIIIKEDRPFISKDQADAIVADLRPIVRKLFSSYFRSKEGLPNIEEIGEFKPLLQYFKNFGIEIDSDLFWTLYRKNKLFDVITNVLKLHTKEAGLLPKARQSKGTLAYAYYFDPKSDLRSLIDRIYKTIDTAYSTKQFESRARIQDRHGNQTTVFSNHLPNYISKLIDPIKRMASENNSDGIKEFIRNKFGDSSFFVENGRYRNRWLRDLTDSSSDFASNFDHYILAQVNFGEHTKSFEQISSKEHALALLANYYNTNNSKFANYPVFILGDSGKARFITAPIYDKNDILNGFVDVFWQELRLKQQFDAIDSALKEGVLDGRIHHDGLPFAGQNYKMLDLLGEHKINELLSQGTSLTNSDIKNAISDALDASFERYFKLLDSLDVLEKDKQGNYTNLKELVKKFQVGQKALTEKELKDKLYQYYINNSFAMSQQLQLMTVSASYYKSVEDLQKRYKEVGTNGNPLNWEHEIFGGNPYETVVYFDDIVINSEINHPEYGAFVAKHAPKYAYKYTENSVTDGQAYRNIDSYRKIAKAQGQWNGQQEYCYQILLRVRKGINSINSPQVKQALETLQASFQPQKPYLFSWEKVKYTDTNAAGGPREDVLYVPVQHKCAETILIPELIPENTPLRALAETMIEQNIDVVCSTTAVKVGNFGATELAYKTDPATGLYINGEGKVILNEDGTMPKSKKEQLENKLFGKVQTNATHPNAFVPVSLTAGSYDEVKSNISNAIGSGYRHSLFVGDYVRQQNLPEHIHDSRAMGTQLRKMVFLGLNMAKDYTKYLVGGRKSFLITEGTSISLESGNGGKNFAAMYSSLISANILDSYDKLIKDINTDKQLSEIFQQLSLNDQDTTMFSLYQYCLTEDEKFLTPLFEGGISRDVTAKLVSLFRKKVNKQLICGGSAVQASAWGISEVQEDTTKPNDGGLNFIYDTDGNITGAECQITWNFKYTNSAGTEVALKYDDYCNEDGTLKLVDTSDPSKGSLLEKEFPGITEFVAYRIPTESSYSMWNLKAVKFIRPELGGIIKLPAEGTTISGFDFDADKLYLIRKEFKAQDFTREDNAKIWKEIYDSNPDIKEILSERRGEELKSLRQANELKKSSPAVIAAIDKLFGDTSAHFEEILSREDLKEVDGNYPLYQFWKEAGLEQKTGMTASDFFSKYVTENGKSHKFEEYHHDKPVDAQTRVARNNEILRLVQCRLSDPETAPFRYTPGGFPESSAAAKSMRMLLSGKANQFVTSKGFAVHGWQQASKASKDDFKEKRDTLDVGTLILYNQQNQVAGTLIGIFANQNINHIYSSLADTLELSIPINFASNSFADLLNSPKGRNASATMAEFLAASVDAVKDPVLNFLNLNKTTADTGALLARLGYNSLEIGLLFNQPIIKELCELASNDPYIFSTTDAINAICDKYEIKIDLSQRSEGPSMEIMASNIVNYQNSTNPKEWINDNNYHKSSQIEVLRIFAQATTAARELAAFLQVTKFTAANTVGSTLGDLYSLRDQVRNFAERNNEVLKIQASSSVGLPISPLQNGKIPTDRKVYMNNLTRNPFAIEQCMQDATTSFLTEICERYYPYETFFFKNGRLALAEVSRVGALNTDTVNAFHLDMPLYLLSQITDSVFDRTKQVLSGDKLISQEEYYLKEFPSKFAQAGTKLNNFVFIGVDSVGNDYLALNNPMEVSSSYKDDFRAAWNDMASSEKQEERDLARDLYIYTMYRHGYINTPTSILEYATPTIKNLVKLPVENKITGEEEITLLDYLHTFMNPLGPTNSITADFIDDAIRQFIRNHPENRLFTRTIRNDKNLQKEFEGDAVPEFIDSTMLSKPGVLWIGKDKCMHAFMYKGNFYEFVGLQDNIYMYQHVDLSYMTGKTCAYYNATSKTAPVNQNDINAIQNDVAEFLGIDLSEQSTPTFDVSNYRNSTMQHLNEEGQLQDKCGE